MQCSKNLSLTVVSTDYQYFPMEEVAGNRVDVIQGSALVPAVFGAASIARVAGKINFAAALICPGADQATLEEVAGTGLTYVPADGITLSGWFNYDVLTDGTIVLGFDGPSRNLLFLGSTSIGGCFLEQTNPVSFDPIPTPSAGAWHFFVLEYSGGTLRWEIDRNGIISSKACLDLGAGNVHLVFQLDDVSGSQWAFDEISFWPQILTNAQKDYLWNGGAGRTVPIVLP